MANPTMRALVAAGPGVALEQRPLAVEPGDVIVEVARFAPRFIGVAS